MGMHVVSPVDRAVSLYHFRDVSLSFTGLRFFKRSSDSLGASFILPFAMKNLVKEFHFYKTLSLLRDVMSLSNSFAK